MGKSSAASSETADTPSPDTAYSANEKVLCHHKNQLYEAKILQVKIEDGAPKYEVHYQGWNNRWDEWVDEDRLMKFSEEKLKEMSSKTPAGKAGGGSQRGRSSQGGGEPSSRSRTPATGGKTKTASKFGEIGGLGTKNRKFFFSSWIFWAIDAIRRFNEIGRQSRHRRRYRRLGFGESSFDTI